MPLPKIIKGNLSEQVYGTIRASLMDGSYEPGERLTIASLADQMGVSITPVREAIFRLVSERALEMRAATSVQVPRLNVAQLLEVQRVRLELEGLAAYEAAARVTPADLAELRDLHARFIAAARSEPVSSIRWSRRQGPSPKNRRWSSSQRKTRMSDIMENTFFQELL